MRDIPPGAGFFTTHVTRDLCMNCERVTVHVNLSSNVERLWACIECERAAITVVVESAMNTPSDNAIKEAAFKVVDQVDHLITRHRAHGPCFDDLVAYARELHARFPQ